MRLVRLIAEFNLVQTRLTHSIVHSTTVATRVSLMRRSAALIDSIERHDPHGRAELLTKIDFFMSRAKAERGKPAGWRDLSVALDLINGHDVAPCQSRSTLPHEVLGRLVDRRAPRGELQRYIGGMKRRASMLDLNFRHICTSPGNARFHHRPQQDFTGLHMRALIGGARFDSRSHHQMSQSMGGRALGYYYALDVPVLGRRVMQCHMRPWYGQVGETGGLVLWVNDVTDDLTPAHGFGDMPHARPDGDHNIDGTT